MGKHIAFLLALACVWGLVGCSQQGQQDITTPNNGEISRADIQSESGQDLQLEIVEIRDREKEENLPCDTALEKFYEDESNEYYFYVIKSQYVVVTYNDGSSEDIAAALNAGRITVADLDRFNIAYRIEPKAYPIEGYTYEELSKMPAEELLDVFIQNGLVINDELKAAFTDEELQTLFKENFHLWHTGVSAHSHTMYIDLAEQTKAIFDKLIQADSSTESGKNTELVEPHNSLPHFSYAEDTAIYVEGEPGVKTSGFVNTTESEITLENVAERAKNECTIEYDRVTTYLDTDEYIWKVHFYTDGMAGGGQSVYLDCDGKTILIVYGE